MGGPDGAVQAGAAYPAFRERRTVAAVSIQGGRSERRRGRAWLLPAECSGYSLGACSLHPVAPGGDIHLGPDHRHQENA